MIGGTWLRDKRSGSKKSVRRALTIQSSGERLKVNMPVYLTFQMVDFASAGNLQTLGKPRKADLPRVEYQLGLATGHR
jgi:hypothetical protein